MQQSRPVRNAGEEALLNIMRTADVLELQISSVLKPHAISSTQYNVLRILRGAGKDGASCKDIGARMVTRDPDVTRMMDRLETRSLIERGRAKEDRRVVTHRLTAEGLELVNQLDRPMEKLQRDLLRHMPQEKLKQLVELLEELRSTP
jgi:DNA-binding MarR family transcriptional regulator